MNHYLNLYTISPKEIVPGFFGKFIHSDKISIAYREAKQGAEIPLHNHIHEMMVNVIEGK